MRATETIKAFRVRSKLPSITLFRARRTHPTFLPSLVSNIQETRLSNIRGPAEFFDYNRVSRPADLNQTTHVRTPSRNLTYFRHSSRANQLHVRVRPCSAYPTTLATSQVCDTFVPPCAAGAQLP